MLTKGSANDYEYFLVFILSQHKKLRSRWKKNVYLFIISVTILLLRLLVFRCPHLYIKIFLFNTFVISFRNSYKTFWILKKQMCSAGAIFLLFVSFDYFRWKNNIFSPTFFRKLYDKIFHLDNFLGFSESHTVILDILDFRNFT